MKTITRAQEIQSHESREIELYTENTEAFFKAIENQVVKFSKAGTFTLDKGIKGAMHTINRAAKQYVLEFGCIHDKWNHMFSKKDREVAAENIVRSIRDEFKLGNYS